MHPDEQIIRLFNWFGLVVYLFQTEGFYWSLVCVSVVLNLSEYFSDLYAILPCRIAGQSEKMEEIKLIF